MSEDVESYVNGELSEEARQAFEQRLLLDPELGKEVAQQRELVASLGYIRLKRQVTEAMQANAARRAKKRWALLLLTVLATGLAGGFLWYFMRVPEPVFEQTVPPPSRLDQPQEVSPTDSDSKQRPTSPPKGSSLPPPIAQQPGSNQGDRERYRGEDKQEALDSNYISQFDAAMKNYPPSLPSGGRFEKELGLLKKSDASLALRLLLKKEANLPNNDTLQYLAAVALSLGHQPTAASQRLYLLNRPSNPFRQESQWLLGLGLLLQGKEDAAVQTLELISKEKAHPRQAAAAALLEALGQ